MDIGKLKNNYTYYKGFEGESEVILKYAKDPSYNIHIWCGYFEDIFDNPILDGNGWKGFTKDYQQDEGAYNEQDYEIDVAEYREDIFQYQTKKFEYSETKEVYELIIGLLDYALENNSSIIMNVS